MRVDVSEIHAPEQANPGDSLTFTLAGFVMKGSIQVERRSEREAELTAWAPEGQPDGWCATGGPPEIGRFETTAPASGAYVLRVRQPDGAMLEKRVAVVDE